MSDLKPIGASRYLLPGFFAAACALLAFHLYPLLQPRLMAGWDLPGHYYLVQLMGEFLEQGTVTGWDDRHFGGYHAFRMYPPLAYIVAAKLSAWIGGSEIIVFNAMVFLLPFCFLGATAVTARLLWDERAATAAVLFCLIFLLLPEQFASAAVGLTGLMRNGYFANYFALPLLVVLLGVFVRIERDPQRLSLGLVAGLLLALVTLSHFILAIFSWWSWLVLLLLSPKQRWQSCGIALVAGTGLSCWWWIPAFQQLGSGSGIAVGVAKGWSDPVEALLPGLFTILSGAWFEAAVRLVQGAQLSELPAVMLLLLRESLSQLPLRGLLLFVPLLYGAFRLEADRRHFLPWLLALSVLLLPRDLWLPHLDLPLQYFRFVQPIWVVAILIAGCGFSAGVSLIRRRRVSVSVWTAAALIALTPAFINTELRSGDRSGLLIGNHHRFFLDQFPDYTDAKAMVDFICGDPEVRSIVDERSWEDFANLGSLHYFSAAVPLQCRKSVMIGLLAESSQLPQELTPLLMHSSRHWSRHGPRDSGSRPLTETIGCIGALGASHLLAGSSQYRSALAKLDSELIVSVYRVGRFELFRILDDGSCSEERWKN